MGSTERLFATLQAIATIFPGEKAPPLLHDAFRRGRSQGRQGKGELILLVEDNPDVRESVNLILTSHGYRTVAVGNGEEAVARYPSLAGEVALVVTDLDMPRLDGRALARKIRAINPTVRILFMSGTCTDETLEEVAALTSAEFLAKPFRLDPLLAKISLLLRS